MSIRDLIDNYYGQQQQEEQGPSEEDLAKQAQWETFAKVAAAQGVDLSQFSDEDTHQLFELTMNGEGEKIAAEDDKPEDKDDDRPAPGSDSEKVERAKKELEQKKEAMAKVAEADELGRVMARAYVDEIQKIASAEVETEEESKVASKMQHVLNEGKKGAKGAWDKAKGFAKENPKSTAAAAGGAAAAAGGAAALARHRKNLKKEASDLDQIAAHWAIEKAAAAGYDGEECYRRLDAMFVLGQEGEMSNEKIASANDFEDAVNLRANELLSLAGYPVEE